MKGIDVENCRRWSVLCLLNFVMVAALGIILRYKIAFSLPFVNYKYLLHAHSHFAFSGWLSTAIFTSFVYILLQTGFTGRRVYAYLFWLAQAASFGMLLSFPFQGYGAVSIFFSVLSVLFSWWFALRYWKDAAGALPVLTRGWIKAALLFFVLSSAGPFMLAYIMSHRISDTHLYYNAVYLFLHFQYNGWFSFAALGLFFHSAHRHGIQLDKPKSRIFFLLMVSACIPAYCLSLLWTDPPAWVFIIATLAGCLQLAALVPLLQLIGRSRSQWAVRLPLQVKILWGLSLFAFAIKLILQALSALPVLGHLAFGFRPVIIGYIHLVVLGFISFFMMGFLVTEKLYHVLSGAWKAGIVIFIAGVFANELLLLAQGLSAIVGGHVPFVPVLLLIAAVTMFAGLNLLLISQLRVKKKHQLFLY
ncbi:hypothetical protein Q4E93_08250 [Flavitalea sp. BT771]|uniref:hypothetical protein n=1 Tax=Flavitalea sp. BT771 TaxID=3063329 RepID=UPI0026E3AC6E|nr:hypothetical protein [Flavitalea sp. BT771]MDO6430574.1 hypothetical protein [Flavitalea sp. BT771]MDV6219286.1 hypothetical protein [Flavitalea sp. BT771]